MDSHRSTRVGKEFSENNFPIIEIVRFEEIVL